MRLFIVRHSKCWGGGAYHWLKHGSLCAQLDNNGFMQGLHEFTGIITQYVLPEHVLRIKCSKTNLRKFDKQMRRSK